MQCSISQHILLEHLQHVSKAVSQKSAVPIFTGIKIEVLPTGLKLTGVNTDMTIEALINKEENGLTLIDHIEPGKIVVSNKYFSEMIRKMPSGIVKLRANENHLLTISCGSFKSQLNGQDAREFPSMPKEEQENSFKINNTVLKELIKQTIYAVSTTETRPILTGVNLQIYDGVITFTATDSHRLSLRKVNLADEYKNIQVDNIVIPGKCLNELSKIINDTEDEVTVSVCEYQIFFATQNIRVLSRLLDGKYPETDRLIPTNYETTIKVSTKNFYQAVDRASLIAKNPQEHIIKLVMLESDLQINAFTPEVGQVTENVVFDQLIGEPLQISFNSKYMLDALKIIDDEFIVIKFTGAMRPFIIVPEKNEELISLILPVRTI